MKRKKGIKILALVLTLSTVMGAVAFADSTEVPLRERIGQLMEDGVGRGSIKEILKEEGYTFEQAAGRMRVLSEEAKTRALELKEEGLERAEIHDMLIEEGILEEGAFAVRRSGSWMSEELKNRIDELKAEGIERTEVKEILEAEGFEFPEAGSWRGRLAQAEWMTEELKSRLEELRFEGVERSEIKEILEAEGFEFPAVKGMNSERMEMIKTYLDQGYSRAEIKDMLAE